MATTIENIKSLLLDYEGQMAKEEDARLKLGEDILAFAKLVSAWLKANRRDSIRLGTNNQCMIVFSSGSYQFNGIVSREQLDRSQDLFCAIIKERIDCSEQKIKKYYTLSK